MGLACRSNVERYYAVFSCELLAGVDLLYFLEEPVCLGKWAPVELNTLNCINRKIFANANAMILENSLLIKEIAEKLGFRYEYYFNRFFFKMAGISPGKYRNQHM